MNHYNINLSSRPFHNNTLHWIAFTAIFAGLILFTWYDAHKYGVTSEEKESWADALEAKRAELVELTSDADAINTQVARMDLDFLHARSSFANGIILSRLFSWSKLFDRLEQIQPELVRIRSIRPVVSSEGINVVLDGATKNSDSLLKFEESLLKSNYFALVYPVQETSRQKREEIEFSVTFSYLPEGKKSHPAAMAPVIDLDELFKEMPGGEAADANQPAAASPAAPAPPAAQPAARQPVQAPAQPAAGGGDGGAGQDPAGAGEGGL